MSNGLLGMDVDASRALAERLGGWSTRSEEIRLVVTEAELLSDIPTGVVGILDEIGGDGAAMAAAIRSAADALSLFTIQPQSPASMPSMVARMTLSWTVGCGCCGDWFGLIPAPTRKRRMSWRCSWPSTGRCMSLVGTWMT